MAGGRAGPAHGHQGPSGCVREATPGCSGPRASPRRPRTRGEEPRPAAGERPLGKRFHSQSAGEVANLPPWGRADGSICGVSGPERRRFTPGRRARLCKEGQGSGPRNQIAGHGAEWLTQARIVCRASSRRTLSFFPPGAGGGGRRGGSGRGLCGAGRAGPGRAGAAGRLMIAPACLRRGERTIKLPEPGRGPAPGRSRAR